MPNYGAWATLVPNTIGLRTEFTITGLSPLKNVVLDKYGQTAMAGMKAYAPPRKTR